MTTATTSTVATGVGGPIEASRIAWRRARSFNPLSGNRSWFGVLFAPWVWPIELLNVATSASRVRRLAGASMTLHDGQPARPDPRALTLAIAVLLAFITAVVTAALPLAEALPIGDPSLAAVAALGILCGPLLTSLVYLIIKLVRVPELRTLNSRRNELAIQTGRPVLVMSSFVRSHQPGEGRQLLEQLRGEWQTSSTTVLLNPANRALADYYLANGADVDGLSWQRLRFLQQESSTVLTAHQSRTDNN